MPELRAAPWPAIVAFYRRVAETRPALGAMADLASRIAASPWAYGLHGATTHEVLVIAQTEHFDPQRDSLQIAAIGGEIAFDFVETVFEDRRWRARVPPSEAFGTLERFLMEKGWFAPTPP
jgi:hypothetical protein